MPSVPTLDLLTRPLIPCLSSFYGAPSSHRLKRLEKGDRRDPISCEQIGVRAIAKCELSLGIGCVDEVTTIWCCVERLVSSLLSSEVSPCSSAFHQWTSALLWGDVSLNDLGDGLTEFLHIQDDLKSESNSILFPPSDKNDISNAEKDNVCEESDKNKSAIVASDECLCKCSTFPCSGETTSCAVSTDGEHEHELDEMTTVVKENGYESAKQANLPPISLPNPPKLVSALKGSREKLGTPPRQLTVTWAPDVYDPRPTAVSHVPTSKKQRHRSDSRKSDGKKNGRNKQKGGGKLGRGKDKKQVRKYGGSSNKFKSLDEEDRVVQYDETYADLVDFDVGNSESYCGSSFLKQSVPKMHFSVAEAT
ncbi:hypothetical protein F0562_016356 [Nyssa sinensis]|uniref:Uncharacterized protein n=1 Tax=Nyssa sinensis TaxID=561372 RepID=A0A5J4ZJL2_9ASTE|nr:hypothetical protein F0562_016356 [Nyssa sinensis]